MGQWVQNSLGNYQLVGGGRTAAIATTELPSAEKELTLELAPPDLNHNVFALIPSSGDGRTAFEIGVIGANIVIRSVYFADPGSVVVHDTAAHGLPNGVPFTLRVRVLAGVIEARLNGSDTPVVDYDTAGQFAGYKHYGFVSNVNGAKVFAARMCDLIPNRVNRADVLVAVIGGDVFAGVDESDMALIAAGQFNATGDVCLVEFEQKMYGFDGAHARIIDAIALTVTPYTASAGALPGATAVPGSCRVTIACAHDGRIYMNDLDDPQNLVATAINDPLDLDTGDEAFGHAFGFTAAGIGRIGQPITAMLPAQRGRLIIGCNNSVWELIGEPSTGVPQLRRMLMGSGVSGKDAITLLAEGRCIAHTPEGPILIPAGGEPAFFAAGVLDDGIKIPREDIADYTVQVRRDPARNRVYFFFTTREPDGVLTHVCYDEPVGGYDPVRGGWFPDDHAERFGPTASTSAPWLGKVVLGTRDGRLMCYDDEQRNDDGEAVTVRCPVTLMQEGKILRETVLHSFVCLQGIGSAIKYRVWGASRPESVYDPASALRAMLQSGQFTRERTAIYRKSRAPALMLELYNDQLTGRFEIEELNVVVEAGRQLTRRTITPAVLPEPCEPSILGSSSSSSNSFTSGPGFTTQFSSSEGTSSSSSSSSSGSSSSSSSGSSSSSSSDTIPVGYTSDITGGPPATIGTNCTIITDPQDDFTLCVTP